MLVSGMNIKSHFIEWLLLATAAIPALACLSCEEERFADISGRWVNDTFGSEATALLEIDDGGAEQTVEADVDFVVDIDVQKPDERYDDQSISGIVTVSDPVYGFSGSYTVDPQTSIYDPSGSCGDGDGMGRIDLVALDGGMRFEIVGGFVCAGDSGEMTRAEVSFERDLSSGGRLRIAFLKTNPDAMGTDRQISLVRDDGAALDSDAGNALKKGTLNSAGTPSTNRSSSL